MKRRGPWRQALRIVADRYLADMGRCRRKGEAASKMAVAEFADADAPRSQAARHAAEAERWHALAEQIESLAREAIHEAES